MNLESHKRFDPLTGRWVLVSPQRSKRPWGGHQETSSVTSGFSYDKSCYLCPGNIRASGKMNPKYEGVYVFDNDFSALVSNSKALEINDDMFKSMPENGICRVICFSPDHNVTLPEMDKSHIFLVIKEWVNQYKELGDMPDINHVMIFENKGDLMGCSNPHPHGQIWAQSSVPSEVALKDFNQLNYYQLNKNILLLEYLNKERKRKTRIVDENVHFVSLVPFWASWPFETMILPRRHVRSLSDLSVDEIESYAHILSLLTIRYDNLFKTSFPYSAGIHQAPTNGLKNDHWQLHMSFYPPLLRSSSVKKFMVGYEMFAGPQRDITPESAAEMLRGVSMTHYKKCNDLIDKI